MNEEQFGMILRSHQKIFHIYFEGFHSYIWQFDDDGLPFNQKISPWIEGEVLEVYKNQSKKRYIKFIKTTFFIF